MLKVCENRVMRGIFGPNRKVVKGGGGNCIMRCFIGCTLHEIIVNDEMGGARSAH
jgi:hypothetical protein